MKIKTLNIVAFGKFKNKTIVLADGFNMVFGGNEAGKSTIQHFIEGILFGFYKPYRKKRTLNEDYYRFKPRYDERYCGSLIYEDDRGREIRVERDFLKVKDGVKIFDNLTGEDISHLYPYDSVTKQYLPMGNTNLNAIVYNNTVNVKQMASKSDEDLAREVNSRLVDLAVDTGDDLSVGNILNYLEEHKKAIGTSRQSKSNYGMAYRELRTLEGILTESEAVYAQIHFNQKQIQQYKKKIEQLNLRYDLLKDRLSSHSKESRLALGEKLAKIREENDALEYQLQMMESHGELDYSTLGRLQAMESSIDALSAGISSFEKTIDRYNDQLLKKQNTLLGLLQCNNGLMPEEIRDDYELYRQSLASSPKETSERIIDINSDGTVSFKNVKLVFFILGILLGAGVILFSLVNLNGILNFGFQLFFGFFGAFVLIVSVFLLILRTKEKDQNKSFVSESKTVRSNDVEDKLFIKYGVSDEQGLLDIFKTVDYDGTAYTQCNAEIDLLNNRIREICREKEKLEQERDQYQNQINEILRTANVPDIESYKEACEDNNRASNLKTRLEANQRLYDELSQSDSILMPNTGAEMPAESNELLRLKDIIEANHLEMAKIIGENNSLMNGVGSPVEIRERIETLQNEIDQYEIDIKACDLAESFFKNFSKNTHYDQAQNLNRKISNIIGRITNKYFEAKVDDNLNVKVIDPDTKALIPIEQLSGGTVDQIYLALRFGVIDMIDLNINVPIILDDPFVQYDEQRKADALRLLSQLSGAKQIVLFTCTSDEKRIMDEAGYAYTGIGI